MRALTLLSTLSLPLLLAPLGCEKDPRPPLFEPIEQNMLQVAQGQGNLSTFVELVGVAQLTPVLQAGTQMTVFAPTDAAFSALPAGTLDALRADPDRLADILLFHIVTGRRDLNLVRISSAMRTFLESNVSVRVENDMIVLSGAEGSEATVVSTESIPANNGFLNTIDAVLTPSFPAADLLGVARQRGYDALVAAIADAGLDGALSATTGLTLFAPTNEAFAAVDLPDDVGLLQNILLTHVLPGVVSSSTLAASSTVSALSNYPLPIEMVGDDLLVGGSTVTEADIMATNGVLHEVSSVIVPPSVLDVAAATPDLSSLAGAVGAASDAIPGVLGGDGPITVFAPVNDAFAPLADLLLSITSNQPFLDDILSTHVATSQVLTSSLTDGFTIEMANGEELTVANDDGEITLTDGRGTVVNVIATDLRLANGVVHLIDGVVLPEQGNVLGEATLSGSTLLPIAAQVAGLIGDLNDLDPVTLFAPSDAAILAQPQLGDLQALANIDPAVVANLLLAHAVAGDLDSTEVLAAAELASLANLTLTVDSGATPPTVGGAALNTASLNIEASNGRVHQLGAVIIPPTTIAVAQSLPELSSLVTAVGNASPAIATALSPDTLNGDTPITVFAPTDQAFIDAGIDPANTPQATLDAVLQHHVLIGQVLTSSLTDGAVLETLNGNLTVNVDGETVTLTDGQGNTSTVTDTVDVRTLSGAVHLIEGVLIP